MNPLELARLEKALADNGCDLTPALDGGCLMGRSTLHLVAVSVRQNADVSIMLRIGDADLHAALAQEGIETAGVDGAQSWDFLCPDYQSGPIRCTGTCITALFGGVPVGKA